MHLFKEVLDDVSAYTPSPYSSRPQYPTNLPVGFRLFSLSHPEARSLLDVVSRISTADPTVLGSLPGVRELCIQTIGWSASHSVSKTLEACPTHEQRWNYLELRALYHIRAACISLNAVLHMIAQDTHKVHWSEFAIPCISWTCC